MPPQVTMSTSIKKVPGKDRSPQGREEDWSEWLIRDTSAARIRIFA